MPTQDFRDLLVWQKSIELVLNIYATTRRFPSEHKWELGRQMRRAAMSIPANIAEGNARPHRREYLHFLYYARSSASELSTHVELATRLGLLTIEQARALEERLDHLSRMLLRLIRRLA
ncbi:MAG TPA: four helix bundle protein [Gemmatimonadaceae bacterium]|nr:four helix bundle protein [Gemmatimonadaceae bacterium]